jgi:hypothetical protein
MSASRPAANEQAGAAPPDSAGGSGELGDRFEHAKVEPFGNQRETRAAGRRASKQADAAERASERPARLHEGGIVCLPRRLSDRESVG